MWVALGALSMADGLLEAVRELWLVGVAQRVSDR